MTHGGISKLTNLMRREASRRDSIAKSQPQFATISSYDPDNYAVKVILQPEEIETEWMELPTQHIGNGWGVMFAPEIEDQVIIAFQDGDRDAPYVVARVFSDEQKPPRLEAGELLVMHKSKGYLMFDKDNRVTVKHEKEHVVTLDENTVTMKHADGHSFEMAKDTVTTKHKDGSGLVFEGGGVVSIKAEKILLDGEVTLGGRNKQRAVILSQDVDTAGNANMPSQSRVYFGSGAGDVPVAAATPDTPQTASA